MKRVLITRPLEDTQAIVETLQSKEIEVSLYPLFKVTFLPAPPIKDPQALLITSKNALRALEGKNELTKVPLLTVGDETAEYARRMGFTSVKSAGGTSKDLLSLALKTYNPTEGSLWYLSGKKIKEDIASSLNAQGVQAEHAIVYDIQDPHEIPSGLREELKADKITHILFFSPRTARVIGGFLREGSFHEALSKVSSLCLSQDVAKEISNMPWKDLWISPRPNVKNLLGYFNDQ